MNVDEPVSSIAITTPRDSPRPLGTLNISNSLSFGGLIELRNMPLGFARSPWGEAIGGCSKDLVEDGMLPKLKMRNFE